MDTAVREAENPAHTDGRAMVNYGTEVEEELTKIESAINEANPGFARLSPRWLSVKLLEADPEIAKKFDGIPERDKIFKQIDESRKHLTDIFADPPEILLTGRAVRVHFRRGKAIRLRGRTRSDSPE